MLCAYCPNHAKSTKTKLLYPYAYSRIADTNCSIRSMSSRDKTLTNRQKTSKLGSFFLPNYGWCSYTTTEYFYSISKKNARNHLFLIQIMKLCLLCKNSFGLGQPQDLKKAYLVQIHQNDKLSNSPFLPHCIRNLGARWETIVQFVIISFYQTTKS